MLDRPTAVDQFNLLAPICYGRKAKNPPMGARVRVSPHLSRIVANVLKILKKSDYISSNSSCSYTISHIWHYGRLCSCMCGVRGTYLTRGGVERRRPYEWRVYALTI